MSLRAKWSILFFVLAVAPLAVLGPIALRVQRAGLERAERELEVAVVDDASRTLASSLAEASQAAHRTGAILTDARIADDRARLDVARDVVANTPSLAYVAIYGTDRALIDAIVSHAGAGAAPPAPTVSAGETGTWSTSGPPNAPVVTYVEPLQHDGEVRGWIAGTLSTSALATAVRELSEGRFGNGDRVLVLDDQLRSLGATSADAVHLGPGLTALARQRDEGLAVTSEVEGPGGERFVATARAMHSPPWTVLVQRPESEAYGALVASRRAFAAASALAAVLALVLAAAFAGQATAPIRRLVELTRAYARRDFKQRSPVTSRDELGQLGASMVEMADAIAASDVEIRRRVEVEANLSRYVPGEVARAIVDGKQALRLGGERRTVSVLFADVASFTTFAEAAPPERVVTFLNELFGLLSEIVVRHGGIVDKFIGDCVMALFGAMEGAPDHAAAAAAAAEDIQRFVQASAPAWKEAYGIDVRLAIGAATGDAVVGNLGSETRMEFTAIGDAVNVASRLEGIARPGQVLVTRTLAEAAGSAFTFASLGEHAVRGKTSALEILELATD